MGLSMTASIFKTVSTSTAVKYPVLESAKAGIPSALKTLKNSSAHPLKLRKRMTIFRRFKGSYRPSFPFHTFIPRSGSVSSRIFEAMSLASASFSVRSAFSSSMERNRSSPVSRRSSSVLAWPSLSVSGYPAPGYRAASSVYWMFPRLFVMML